MGLALLVDPGIVAGLLLGVDQLVGVGEMIARVTGIALIGLGLSCWPGSSALVGILTYSLVLTLHLARLGFGGELVGVLLWPAVALHALLTGSLAWAWLRNRPSAS